MLNFSKNVCSTESYDNLFNDNDRSQEFLLSFIGGSVLFLIAFSYILVKSHEKKEQNFENTKNKYKDEIAKIVNKLEKLNLHKKYITCVDAMYNLCKKQGLERVVVENDYDGIGLIDHFIKDENAFNNFLKDRLIREMVNRGIFKSKKINKYYEGHAPYITLRFKNPPDELFKPHSNGTIQVNPDSYVLKNMDRLLVLALNNIWKNAVPLKGNISDSFSDFMKYINNPGDCDYEHDEITKHYFVFDSIDDAKKNHIICAQIALSINFDEIFKLIES